MKLFHGPARRRAHLLAAGALESAEAEAARRHLARCGACRDEHDQVRATLALVERDPSSEPPLPLAVLARRVQARLDEEDDRAASRGARRLPLAGVAWSRPAWAAAAAVLALVTVVAERRPAEDVVRVAASPPSDEALLLPADSLQRLERGVARAQTARYLNEAQDVLVTVAARLPRCTRRAPRVEVAAEARRSRELLARRALMVETGNGHAASARGVLDDVERVLREVAAFDDCESSRRVEELGAELDERRLLMRMALVERELLG